MLFRYILLSYLLLFVVNSVGFAKEVIVPKLTSPVVDNAKIFSIKEATTLRSQIKEIYQKGGPQIQVLSVKDLQGFTIEEFSIRVAEKWTIGSKEKGDGVIITISKNDRKVRIEVGDGIEGTLTDYSSRRIIQKHMIPLFKDGEYGAGVQAAIDQISKLFKVNLTGDKVVTIKKPKLENGGLLLPLLSLFLICVFIIDFVVKNFFKSFILKLSIGTVLFFIVFKSFLMSLWMSFLFTFLIFLKLGSRSSSGWGGRSSGWGGGSSGWGGGGGGFSGGGSSGSW